jgi:hypothetical protein
MLTLLEERDNVCPVLINLSLFLDSIGLRADAMLMLPALVEEDDTIREGLLRSSRQLPGSILTRIVEGRSLLDHGPYIC